MTTYGIIALINATALFAVSFLLLQQNFKKRTFRNFALVVLMIGLWEFFVFVWQGSSNQIMAEYWSRVMMAWTPFVPVFFYKFILYLIGEHRQHQKRLYLSYFIALFFAAGSLLGYFSNGISHNVTYVKYYPHAGLLFMPFIIYFFILLFYSVHLLYKKYPEASPVFKLQIKYIILGTTLAYLFNFTNYFWWYDINFPPIGNLVILLLLFIVIYAVLTRHMVDLNLAVRKSTVYLISAILLFFEVLIAKLILERLFMAEHFWVDFIIIFGAIFTYPKLKKQIYGFSNKYFFTSFYIPAKVIETLSHGLNTTLSITKIYKLIDEVLSTTFHAASIAILLYDKTNNRYKIVYNRGFGPDFKNNFNNLKGVYQKIIARNRPVIIEELKKEAKTLKQGPVSFENIDQFDIDLISPLAIDKHVVGLLILGKKISLDIYNDDDLKVLKTAGEEIAMAIENAKLYKRIEDFNKTLQQRVELQTKSLNEKNEHLTKLAEMRSEFLDIASHQLRTPVSVIKGVLSMIEEGSIPPEKEKEFISGALEKSIKLGEIINDLLRASEMDSEKFSLHNQPTSLDEIIKKMKNDKLRFAQVKKISFSIILPETPLPLIMGDERYLEHAIINLVNNAIQYTPNGSVTVTFEATPDTVIIRVIDTGIGISQANIHKLFQKFSRADNAVEAYADGSGLGLFIVKQVVDATPGAKVEVEQSELGKGTTFALTLPVAKPLPAKITVVQTVKEPRANIQ